MHRLVDIRDKDGARWSSFTAEVQQLLNAAMMSDGASKGNVQLFNPYVDGLQIVAHHGFDKPFLQRFGTVRWDEPTACGRAYRYGVRVVIPDISVDRLYAPYLSIAQASGYRAVQSTPIIQSGGSVIGVLSTHFGHAHAWTDTAQSALDHSAANVAALVTKVIQISL
jgi:GAF domain-containing protein